MSSRSFVDQGGHVGLKKRILQIAVEEDSLRGQNFWFPDHEGGHEALEVPDQDLATIREGISKPKYLLGQWVATAVCGNDVMSSCTYSAAVVGLQAGVMAPVAFVIVSLVLYMYRFVYDEVVTAIPLNGGAYNALLNTTSKRFAAVAACMSILCYTATAVISATTAVNYLAVKATTLPIVGTSVGLLGLFAILMLIGIKESSIVAFAMFVLHIMTLSILVVVCLIHTIKHPETLKHNYTNITYPDVNYMGATITGTLGTALFFGFGAAMLGVTGFETSANFVEEQKPGVFGKTMRVRNMWSISSFFNVVLAVLVFGVLEMDGPDGIVANQNYVLAQMGLVAAGAWAQWLVVIDAFIVLSGAVLTAYVGINGLARRLASDRVMPNFFITQNKLRGSCHWIILSFFVIASSLVIILNADQTQMAGVYTYSFLSMMFLFGTGCILLKLKRRDIPRQVHAPWWCIVLGMTLVVVGFLANLLGNPKTLMYFVSYFIFVFLVIFGMLERVFLLRVLVVITNVLFKDKKSRPDAEEVLIDDQVDLAATPDFSKAAAPNLEQESAKVSGLVKSIKAIKNAPVVFYIKQADLTTLNKAILYVRANELTHNLRFVHFYASQTPAALDIVAQLKEMIAMFDHVYPKIRLDFYSVVGEFEPAGVEWISRKFDVPTNMMFLKQPSSETVHKVSAYGVRVITG
ncbi:Aste57867_18811 [Aphanomyces stellatus]|uniref:Aste57867_18811 protein n=1 Tax=Aphanomyces stellatus TaxID=120398 RepID=A0A485LD01_9STRA|nr:hypothetical protein As57867_018747 [Aphanomyces stellatus]VFT95545.1 Aste57867_18811 [Aphanomyces stellatus]